MSSEARRTRSKSQERKQPVIQTAFFLGCARIDAKHRKGCSPLYGAKRRRGWLFGQASRLRRTHYGVISVTPYRSAPFVAKGPKLRFYIDCPMSSSFLQYYTLEAVVSHAAQMIRLRSHHVAADFCAVRNSIASTARRTAPAPCALFMRCCQ